MPSRSAAQGWLESWARRPAAQRLAAEAGVLAASAAVTWLLPWRIPQPASYHSFAGDYRSFLGIPHAANVLSNATMALPGAAGLLLLWKQRGGRDGGAAMLSSSEAMCWACTFVGMLAAAGGSARYHFNPNNRTLAWDRLGMTSAFASQRHRRLHAHIAPGALLLRLLLWPHQLLPAVLLPRHRAYLTGRGGQWTGWGG